MVQFYRKERLIMFIEFDNNTLEEWNNLSDEEKKQKIAEDNVQIAVNVDIKIESHNKVLEEHKYYQVTSHLNLINDIIISSVSEQETTISIKNFNNEDELITIKTDEESTIEIGPSPYKRIYRIKVSNVKYGRILEL